MPMVKHCSELEVWKKADQLAHEVFTMTEAFPRRYLFDLTTRLRRAALSVPTNIVEGSASPHSRELLQLVNVARRSVREVQYLLLFSLRRDLISAASRAVLEQAYEEVHRMLNGLTRSLRGRK